MYLLYLCQVIKSAVYRIYSNSSLGDFCFLFFPFWDKKISAIFENITFYYILFMIISHSLFVRFISFTVITYLSRNRILSAILAILEDS